MIIIADIKQVLKLLVKGLETIANILGNGGRRLQEYSESIHLYTSIR